MGLESCEIGSGASAGSNRSFRTRQFPPCQRQKRPRHRPGRKAGSISKRRFSPEQLKRQFSRWSQSFVTLAAKRWCAYRTYAFSYVHGCACASKHAHSDKCPQPHLHTVTSLCKHICTFSYICTKLQGIWTAVFVLIAQSEVLNWALRTFHPKSVRLRHSISELM